MEDICFIDFETTGVNLIDDYPIELGAVLVDNNLAILNEFHSYIKPNNIFKLHDTAFEIHGIKEEQILNSPSESSVLNELFSKIGTNYRLAAWNMSFDVAFFKTLCQRNSFDFYLNKINYRHIDVQTISFIAKKMVCVSDKINSFSDAVSYFQLTRSTKHSAIEDAKLLHKVYKLLLHRINQKFQHLI